MGTLEITIQRSIGDGWPVVVEQNRPGTFLPVRNEGVMQLDKTLLQAQSTPLAYGTLLGQALFRDQVREAFLRADASSENTLRILLFVEANDLKTLRWERLCAPFETGWRFLALNQQTLYSLYLPSVTDRRFPAIGRRDLHALVIIACPDGLEEYRLAPFDAAAAAAGIRTALGDIPYHLLANGEGAIGPPTLDALCDRLVTQQYTLVHAICHGQFHQHTGETSIFLADANNQVDRIDATRLIDRLQNLNAARGLPHFAFLATCDSAAPEAEGTLGGLAQRLVRDLGMPAVIAMTDKVSITTAQTLTTSFYRQLRQHGEVDRALVEATSGLAGAADVTVPVLYSRLGERKLFSDLRDGPLTPAELRHGLERMTQATKIFAPVLEATVQQLAQTLRPFLDTDPNMLTRPAAAERQRCLSELNVLSGEVLDLPFEAIALGQEWPAYDTRCPFRGLVAFRPEDSSFFFGREALVERLATRVRAEKFLALVGPSGCGKSSLVFAGLVPALQSGDPELRLLVMTPGSDPTTRLAALHPQLAGSAPILLVIDQFEELFTLCADRDQRKQFLDQLLALAQTSTLPSLLIVLTLRADFLGEGTQHPGLKNVLQSHQELIAAMTGAELRSAIEQQARAVGLRFEADLANTMLDDVEDEPGAMPLLQHALLELWKRRHGRWLRTVEYRATGGVRQAIAASAEGLYQQLAPAHRQQLHNLLLRLVRLDDDARPDAKPRDTRQRSGFAELLPGEEARPDIELLISRLADARLVITSQHPVTGEREVELAHEALIDHWQRLRDWLTEDRAGNLVRQQVSQGAEQWWRNKRDNAYLYRGSRLAAARAWAGNHPQALTTNERAFLQRGATVQGRQQIMRLALGGFVIALVAVVLYALITERGPFAPRLAVVPVPAFAGMVVTDIAWRDDSTVYVGLGAGNATSSMAVSHDAGDTWAFLDVHGKMANSIAPVPNQPDHVFSLLNNQGLLLSEYGGEAWRTVNSRLPITFYNRLVVSPAGILYIGDDRLRRGIFASHDQGMTWSSVPNSPAITAHDLQWLGDRLMVASSQGLWRWREGSGWQSLIAEPVQLMAITPLPAGLLAAGGSGIFEVDLTDGVALIADEPVTTLAADSGNPPTVLASTLESRLLLWRHGSKQLHAIGRSADLNPAAPFINLVEAPPKTQREFWITTENGLYKVYVRRWFQFGQP